MICVPSAITAVERRAVKSARKTGAADARLIEQPLAAASGPVYQSMNPWGTSSWMWVAAQETALISMGVLSPRSCGSVVYIDTAIQNYIKAEYGVAIGERTAEQIKLTIGSAAPIDEELELRYVEDISLMTFRRSLLFLPRDSVSYR